MILYFKNIVSLFNFLFLKFFFWKRNNPGNKNILFFNSEKIGDLVVSSLVLENDDFFPEDVNVYFLIKENFYPLFENYKGGINIITYNYKKYKWFLPYRFIFIKYLRSLMIDKFYNLTPARGMLNDEISLLSGSNIIHAINNDKKYLKGFTGKITDKYYDEILFQDIKNEYEKHIKLLEMLGIYDKKNIFGNKKTFENSESNYLIEKKLVKRKEYIAISPLSTDLERTWGIKNYSKLSKELAETYRVVLIGSPKEKLLLERIRQDNKNILIDTSSLKDLPGIINHCLMFIGGDSGLTHIALKLGKPFLAILDGGYFNRYFPYRIEDKNNNYIYYLMDCFECGFDCIFDKKYCLINISYDDVINKTNKILKNLN
jgi:ADP-heptose:LPS heptosyltransferase